MGGKTVSPALGGILEGANGVGLNSRFDELKSQTLSWL
jgi:hypothetical protein